ncbi:hypothetical protein HanPI659440_Chr10g0365901 [Helianthus annuus]|nr:hypothetical protein HanPI659440_Chr10g0365901 [Helianthus annuus]
MKKRGEEKEEEPSAKLVIRKRSREETTAGASFAQKAGRIPLIGKQSNLRSLYKFSPEAKKKTPEKRSVIFKDPPEPVLKKTKVTIKPFKAAGSEAEKEKSKAAEREKEKEKDKKEKGKASGKPAGDDPKETGPAAITAHDKAQGPEVLHVTRLDQPLHEKRKEPEFEKLAKPAQPDAPLQAVKITSTTGGSGSDVHKEKYAAVVGASAGFAAGQAGVGVQSSMPRSPIGSKDTLGDIYYKSYTEEARGDASHQPPWGLKQKDTFLEFATCRDWFLNSLLPGEVNRQRA